MKCTVLLFAQLRETIGCDSVDIDLFDGATVRDALNLLARDHSVIAQMRGKIAVAVNEKYAPMNAQLSDRCTIALIPPVSGG